METKKSDLRNLMRVRRRALSQGERTHASQSLCKRLYGLPYFSRARKVGIYLPIDGEIDVTPIVTRASTKQFFLPILPPRGQRRLWFGLYRPGTKMVSDRFGIPEPVTTCRVRAESLDLILVPLVAFDYSGGRIGMGGGFYDTSLSFLGRQQRLAPLRVIGAAYQFQEVDFIPRDSWDIPLHGVLTDRCFIPVGAE